MEAMNYVEDPGPFRCNYCQRLKKFNKRRMNGALEAFDQRTVDLMILYDNLLCVSYNTYSYLT